MNKISKLFTISALAVGLAAPLSFAQDHHDDHRDDRHDDRGHYVRHDEWKRGYHMNHQDWDRGQRIDYRQYHLSAPRRGYEWRQVDGNYVMAAIATGVIASTVIAATAR